EVPNSLYTLRDLGIWDLIYEHCSYFCAGSLGHTFEESGFSVVDIREEFDGQFLSIVACPKGESRSMEQWEEAGDIAPYVRSFRASYLEKRHNWRCWLKAAYETGKKVVLWGGGSKGVTFLNVVANGGVEYVVDINPNKWGMYVAGAGQEIVSPQSLVEYRPDYVLLMNPIYEPEVHEMIGALNLNPQVLIA
ncbi:MAG: methyltransferase, partial [Pyrinomonadaceae bacterium]